MPSAGASHEKTFREPMESRHTASSIGFFLKDFHDSSWAFQEEAEGRGSNVQFVGVLPNRLREWSERGVSKGLALACISP